MRLYSQAQRVKPQDYADSRSIELDLLAGGGGECAKVSTSSLELLTTNNTTYSMAQVVVTV